ncbi:MAG: hypothetical protein IJG40_09630 [Oscillospiraceae bacterium]|nr:hypothetical protein [Oscillospiraceae bacterium]
MKKFNTCEEYVLAELEEKKEQLKKLSDACKAYREFFEATEGFINVLKQFLTIRKASCDGEVISMNCVFEKYEPNEFKLIKEMFDLEAEDA